MSTNRRVITDRPVYRPRNGVAGNGGTASPNTTTPCAHAARGTTTTNVVSVVPSAVRVSAREPAHASQPTVAELVEKLTPEYRKELLDRLLAEKLLADPKAADRDLVMWSEAVHRALVRVIGAAGGGVVGPGVIQKVLRAGEAWKHVEDFMALSRLGELPVNERQRAYYLLADLLVRHARQVSRKSGAPLSPKLVANCAVNLAGVFEDNFPGYLEAGMAKMVARSTAAV